jgi:uncharacterized membrane protein YgaE (UPF0421/DUF939 family)
MTTPEIGTQHIRQHIIGGENPATPVHSARTAVAAVLSLLVARFVGLPEAYWASISTLIVMQSTLTASLPLSVQRFAGTALGAGCGGLLATYLKGNILAFGAAVLVIGLLCSAFHVERTAYRHACVTLAIIMLIPRTNSPWVVAGHRFLEVSIGIVVALITSSVARAPTADASSGTN